MTTRVARSFLISQVTAWMLPTNEDLIIARHTLERVTPSA
jgi:hypothetical protein